MSTHPHFISGDATVGWSQMRKIPVVFVMGEGRSGSTILTVVLNDLPGINSAGELIHWVKFSGERKVRDRVDERGRWRRLKKEFFSNTQKTNWRLVQNCFDQIESYEKFPYTYLGCYENWVRDIYWDHSYRLFSAFQKCVGPGMVVDSSKNIARALMLKRNPYLDVKILYLTRNPCAVVSSMRKRQVEQAYKPMISAIFQINVKKFLSFLIRIRLPRLSVLKVQYEDVVLNPAQALPRIGRFLDVSTSDSVSKLEQGRKFEVPCMFDGNRIRNENEISVAYDGTWEGKLSKLEKVFIYFCTFQFRSCFQAIFSIGRT